MLYSRACWGQESVSVLESAPSVWWQSPDELPAGRIRSQQRPRARVRHRHRAVRAQQTRSRQRPRLACICSVAEMERRALRPASSRRLSTRVSESRLRLGGAPPTLLSGYPPAIPPLAAAAPGPPQAAPPGFTRSAAKPPAPPGSVNRRWPASGMPAESRAGSERTDSEERGAA